MHTFFFSPGVGLTLIRCTLTCLSLGGSALFLLIVAIVTLTGHTPFSVSLVCITLVYLFHGLSMGGSFLNPLDLAPSHAGFLFSAMATVGAFAGEYFINFMPGFREEELNL